MRPPYRRAAQHEPSHSIDFGDQRRMAGIRKVLEDRTQVRIEHPMSHVRRDGRIPVVRVVKRGPLENEEHYTEQ